MSGSEGQARDPDRLTARVRWQVSALVLPAGTDTAARREISAALRATRDTRDDPRADLARPSEQRPVMLVIPATVTGGARGLAAGRRRESGPGYVPTVITP
jgi:hypothetical protein